MREYLLRGGFFMADDFHGETERHVFEDSMKLVFPERPIVDIPDGDPIFHTVYDLQDRVQHLRAGNICAKDAKTATKAGGGRIGAASMTTKAV